MTLVLPGSTIGVLGSGQLGRMFAIAARQMGYRVFTFSPETDTPTGQVADREWAAPFTDLDSVRNFAEQVDVVTFEFENIPLACVEAVQSIVPVHPSGEVLHTTQHRLREKSFLAKNGFPVTAFRAVNSAAELEQALQRIGAPSVLKTAGFGYDGKGQSMIKSADEAASVYRAFEGKEAILEAFVDFELEMSVVAARALDGGVSHYGVLENSHKRHVLDVTVAPARVPGEVAKTAIEIACAVLESLQVVGVMCVEMFLTKGGKILINELAPRPHNSGHLTIDACATSQFEQQLRAVCGLPLGSAEFRRPAAMANLLGDIWESGEPAWNRLLAEPSVKLHLYGKAEARKGRKMGHITALAETADAARIAVLRARDLLEKSA